MPVRFVDTYQQRQEQAARGHSQQSEPKDNDRPNRERQGTMFREPLNQRPAQQQTYAIQPYVAAFTGGQLAGKSITTRGNRVHVRLLSDNSVSHYGFRVTAVAAYLQPTLTQCYATGATRGVRLSWNGTSLIDGYYIYRATTTRSGSTGAFTYLAKVSGSQSSFVDQAAVPGVINSYKMLAYNRVSGVEYRSGMSNVLNMSPLGKAVIASVTSDGSGSVQIRWNAVSNATGYALYGATQANGTYTQLGTVTNGVNSCRVDGLGSDPVFFKLRAVVKVDQTSYMGPYSDAKVGVANFTAPTITGTHSPSATAMTVEWGSVPGATSYRVYRDSAANGAYSTYIGSFTGTSCTDRSAPSGRYSYYKVRAVLSYTGGTLYSNLSAYCSAYPLAVPTMAVANLGGKTARVTWGAVANATAYDVYVSLDGSTYSLLTSATAQERSCDVTFEEDITAGYFKMRAVRQGGSKRFTSNMCGASTVSLTGGSSSVTYRALSIGQLYPGEAQALQGTDLDANSIKAMLETMTATPYAVTRKLNLTASGIVSSIASTFAGADSDDVSLFFYSGHGLFDSNNDYLGALCGVGGLYSTDDIVSPTRLRTALDKIPGTKIVIINACHSGNMIGKGEESSADAFTNSFIQEFSRAGKSNLATNGYYVLVAASKTESGYMLQTNGVWAGVFTRGVCVGSGWNELTSSYTSLYADSNGDRSITLHELYDYSYGYVVSNLSTVGVMQHVQVYPTGSSFVLYGRQ